MTDLPEILSTRAFRLECSYTASRLAALEETRALAKDFEEAADKLALLEEEDARLDVRRMETQANVETADDAWDDTMHALQRRLLELSNHDMDAPLYRRYFADIPSHVTSLTYQAELMISKDLETDLATEEVAELKAFADRLRERREPLENALVERTRLEVEEARFANRVALAKTITNKLRRTTFAKLLELAGTRSRSEEWCARFFHTKNTALEALDRDGVRSMLPRTSLPSEAIELDDEQA
ncbi:hypothetical protein L6R52_02020 [Myxococcota bacterium]|nr:hypothetical protein [Myxococcota bacterium]